MATELGHITILPDGPLCNCGQSGHLETFSSGPAIARHFLEKLTNGVKSSLKKTPLPTSKEIAAAALQGVELSLSAFKRAGTYLGIAIANYLQIFNPTCVVLGGGVSITGDLLLEPTRKVVEQVILSKENLKGLTITKAKLGDNAGLIGALVLIKINHL